MDTASHNAELRKILAESTEIKAESTEIKAELTEIKAELTEGWRYLAIKWLEAAEVLRNQPTAEQIADIAAKLEASGRGILERLDQTAA